MSLDMEEDCNAEEETQGGRDRHEAPAGGRFGFAGSERCRCDPSDWRHIEFVLDDLMSAFEHEFYAAEVSEGGPTTFDV